jgi:hypothetical protein
MPIYSAVTGLYGCTSVVVVSTKGAWISHFFEANSFLEGQAKFEQDVLDGMTSGDGTPFMQGLEQYTNLNGIFADDTDPTAIIVTPDEVPSPFPPTGNALYPNMVDQIKTRLLSIMPSLEPNPPEVFTYTKTNQFTASDWSKSIGKVLFQFDPEQA